MPTSSSATEPATAAPRVALAALGHLARIAFGLVFLAAAVMKSLDLPLFAEQIAGYEITPVEWSMWQAKLFIVLEMIVGVALIVNFRPRITIPAGIAMMLLFIGVLIVAMRNGYTGECGCFGGASARTPMQAVVEDLVFLGLGVTAWFGMRTPPGLAARGRSAWQAIAVLIALAAGIVAPTVGDSLPLPSFATAARAGAHFDHIIVEEFEGDIHDGRYVVVVVDPVDESSVEILDPVDRLVEDEDVPPVVGVFQGNNEQMVEFLLENAPAFDGMGHAPQSALRRFYRRLPVVMALEDGVIVEAWHEKLPTSTEVLAAYARG